MNILIIGGFTMTITDGEAYWSLAQTLAAPGNATRIRECAQSGQLAPVTPADLLWADAVICYSYGMASYINLAHALAPSWPAGKTHQLLVVIAGVPDFWMGQFYTDLWQLPEFVDSARCFQVDAVPASEPIRNRDALWLNFGQPIPAGTRWANFNCNPLVANLAPIDKHTHIQNHPQVHAAIAALFVTLPAPAVDSTQAIVPE